MTTYIDQRKHIFKNSEIEHIWAQQKYVRGSNPQHNVFFEGPSLYSYGTHFETARFVTPDVVLVTNRGYSVTTSGHVGAARCAVTHKLTFTVPSFDDHNLNAQYLVSEIRKEVEKIKRARSGLLWAVKNLKENQSELGKYLEAFKKSIGAKLRRDMVKVIKAEFFSAADLKEFTKKEKRNEEVQARTRETRRVNDQIRWQNRGRTQDEARAHMEGLIEAAERVWLDELLELNRAAWVAGDDRARIPYDAPVMLRVKDGEIETSQGAIVPIGDAKKLWALIKAGEPIKGFEIGHYTVTGVHDRKLVIGCHKIPVSEVARMARTLNLTSNLEVI